MIPRKGKRMGQLAVVLAITLDTARRIFEYGLKPIYAAMLTLEIIIVVLILYEILFGGEVLPKWKMKRRVKRLFGQVSHGQLLQQTVPPFSQTGPNVAIEVRGKWEQDVTSWIMNTNHILQS